MKSTKDYSIIWQIAWPIILSSLANTVINFTDVAFVARVGEKELAASALGGVFYFVLVMIGIGFGIGLQILIARRTGENRNDLIGEIFDNGLLLMLSFTVLMEFLVYLLMPSFINLVVSDSLVADACVQYLFARSWGLFFMMVLIALRSFYTGLASTRIITYTTVVMMLLNILFNYCLTLGNCGFTAMGIFGSGLSSALAEAAAAIYAIVYTFRHSEFSSFNLFRFKKLSVPLTKQIFSLSAPIVFQHLISMMAWFTFFVLIERLGSHELAVSNIVRSIYMVLMTPIWGFSQAANSMVSNLIGQSKVGEVTALVKRVSIMSLITGVITTVLFLIFPEFIFHLTTSDNALIAHATNSFYIICAATVVFSVSMILLSSISGTGSTKAAMYIEISNISIYLIYIFSCSFIFNASVEVIWCSEIVYWLLMGIFSAGYLYSGKWRLNIENLSADHV
jgi:putative MATE family efflux protein